MPNLPNSAPRTLDRTPRFPEDPDNRDPTPSRTIGKRFYLTPEENQRLDEMRQGIPLSAFVRAKLFGSTSPRPRPIVPQLDRQAYVHLAALRHHCHDIAIALQANPKAHLTQENWDQLDHLEALLIAIGQQLPRSPEENPS
jgi:hypothetical protein